MYNNYHYRARTAATHYPTAYHQQGRGYGYGGGAASRQHHASGGHHVHSLLHGGRGAASALHAGPHGAQAGQESMAGMLSNFSKALGKYTKLYCIEIRTISIQFETQLTNTHKTHRF